MDLKLCDDCKVNQATIHLTQIINNEVTVRHLCEVCAKKKGISIVIDEDKVSLSHDSEEKKPERQSESFQEKKLVCSKCQMVYDEFREKGWLGCPYCYSSFEKEIDKLLIQVHGTCHHKGKHYRAVSGALPDTDDLVFLRKELDNAIRNEKFERAAAIRDKINSIFSNESSTNGQG
jgi:protein arginine kinase activator